MQKLVLYLFLIFSLTSCFEVIEEVSLQEDGSGDFKLTVNLSKSKAQVKSLLSMDTVQGKHVPSVQEIDDAIEMIANDLRSTEGVSNVTTSKNFEDFILSIGYHFDEVAILNKSIKNVIEKHARNRPDLSKTNFFSLEGNTFKRIDEFDFGILMANFSADTKVLETSTFTCIYRLPNTIISQSNSKAKQSKSGKASMNRLRASQLIKNKSIIKNEITYNK